MVLLGCILGVIIGSWLGEMVSNKFKLKRATIMTLSLFFFALVLYYTFSTDIIFPVLRSISPWLPPLSSIPYGFLYGFPWGLMREGLHKDIVMGLKKMLHRRL
jgi:uncharacterized membrane protein YfcA